MRVLLVVALALVLRLLTAGQGVMTTDEGNWLYRSERFETALRSGDFDNASASAPDDLATRPGVTTMWVGTAARVVGAALIWADLTDRTLDPGHLSALALQLSQIVMAVVSSALIGVVVLLGRRPLGATASIVTGLLMALEPWLVAHNSVLHTDGLVTLSLAASALAMFTALGWDRSGQGDRRNSWRWAVGSGFFLGLAALTKLSAVLFAPGLAVIALPAIAASLGDRRRSSDEGSSAVGGRLPVWTRPIGLVALAGVITLGCFVALNPALWSNPGPEFGALTRAAGMGGQGHDQFFMGETTVDPGGLFYPVSLLFRLSPWIMVLAVAGAVLAVAGRVSRTLVLALLVVPLPYAVAMALATKKFDRYMLPVVPFLAMVGALAVTWLWSSHVVPRVKVVPRAAAAGLLVACLALPTVRLSHDTMAYVNPIAAADGRAERTILVGWGEGIERYGERIAQDEAGRCDEIVIATGNHQSDAVFPCGRLVPLFTIESPADLKRVDYVTLYPLFTQRDTNGDRLPKMVRANATLVMRLELSGVDYGGLYRVEH